MSVPNFLLRPSAASMWMRCVGYASMIRQHPEVDGENEVRDEGTACHWMAYEVGSGRPVAVGTKAPNGVETDDDMAEAVAGYLAMLRSWGVPVYLEHSIQATSVHPTECGGTVDAWAWDAVNRILYVGDLKYGFRSVDAYMNWQLLVYVRAVLDYLQSVHGKFTEHFTVVMCIYQPRDFSASDPIKTWRVNSVELRPLMTEISIQAQKAVLVAQGQADMIIGNAYTPSPNCIDCNGAHSCEALRQASMRVIDAGANCGNQPRTAKEAGQELRLIDRAMATLAARQKALEAQLEHDIQRGSIVEHFEVNSGRGRKVWKDGCEEKAIAMGALLGKTLAKPVRALTPTQAAELFPGSNVLDQFIETRAGKMKLRRLAENHADKLFRNQ